MVTSVLSSCEESLTSQISLSLPKHIAIIMDGNRRWAQQKGVSIYEGHKKGADVLDEIVTFSHNLGIEVLTAFAFSTENWGRSFQEVTHLMALFEEFLRTKRADMVEKGIKFNTIGSMKELPRSLSSLIDEVTEQTKHGKGLNLVLAINYGARNEIVRASLKLARALQKGELKEEQVDEKCFASFLDTASWQEPDLFIRTSGEMRLSNFLLWQLSYSEVYISPLLWPDFTQENLMDAIKDYQKRHRRMGKQ